MRPPRALRFPSGRVQQPIGRWWARTIKVDDMNRAASRYGARTVPAPWWRKDPEP